MPDSTEERQKTTCISGQERFVMEAFNTMVEVRLFSQKLSELSEKVDRNDKKHTDAISDLRKFFLDQNMVVVDSVGDLKKSVDAMMAHVTPMVNREEKVKSFILKWSIPTICSLLLAIVCIVYFGDHAAEIGEFVKAVK